MKEFVTNKHSELASKSWSTWIEDGATLSHLNVFNNNKKQYVETVNNVYLIKSQMSSIFRTVPMISNPLFHFTTKTKGQ